jgi:aminoglycoside phosphotransferase (APT) family kinase protein
MSLLVVTMRGGGYTKPAPVGYRRRMPLAPPPNSRPPNDALRLPEPALAAWLSDHVPGCKGGRITVTKFKGGQSNPTYWIGVEGGDGGDVELVLRKKPPGKLLPSAHAVDREYRIMRALAGTDVPVPDALALCEEDAVVGATFFVMRHVNGRIFWNPQVPELPSTDERRALYDEYVRVLVALHQVDPAKVGLADYGKIGGYMPRQVERWSLQYEASRTDDVPAMNALVAWLKSRTPDTDETTLVHGDYRLDNLMWSPEVAGSPKAIATLDWELSTLGHPLCDLAYACMSYHLALPGRGGLLGVDLASLGIPTEAELVDTYCRATGRAKIGSFSYFMAFGIFRLAAIAQGVYKRGLQGNASSDEASGFGAAVTLLAELACGIAGIATTAGA